MKLTKRQINELLELINFSNLFFIAENVGFEYLTESEKTILKETGVEIPDEMSTVEQAFKFGVLTMALGDDQVKNMNYAKFKDFVLGNKFIPLTKLEKEALENVKYFAAQELKGLGNRYSQNFGNIMIEVDQKQRANYEKVITKQSEEAILKREGVKELISRFGHATGDWSRDFGRMADYIHHDAMDRGRITRIAEDHGADAEIYKDVYPGACKHCVSLYLTGGIGSKPKIFKLSEIVNNGTNIGRKTNEWKPVVGPTHPWCRCTINRKAKNREWDEKTNDFTKLDPNKIDSRIRGKVKVSINK